MKRVLLLLIAVAMCLPLCSCDSLLEKVKESVTGNEASQPPENYIGTFETELYVYDEFDDYISVTEYLGEETAVTIPSEIDGKTVKVIGSLCFFQTDVVSVSIPDTVTEIAASAFYCADALTSLVIPDTVTKIGMRAFGWCDLLESVTIGNGITEIPDYCFNHCASLKSIVIPTKVTKIGIRAFSYCENLTEVTVHKDVNAVGDRCFTGCKLLDYVIFENGSTVLTGDVFAETPSVAIIAEENSAVYNYCAEKGLRWSSSKSIDAVQLTPPQAPEESDSDDTQTDTSNAE